MKNPKIGVNFPKDMKHELIVLLKEFRERSLLGPTKICLG